VIRPVQTESEIETFLAIREAVDPAHPMTRESWDADQKIAGRLDVLCFDDEAPVGCAFGSRQYGDPTSPIGYISVRVLEEHRRRGHGTALLRHLSEHVRGFGGTSLYGVTAATTTDMLGFFAHHGLSEVGRMQDVELELAAADASFEVPEGIELVPLTEDLDAGAHAVALEADADIPAASPIATGDLARWRERNLDELAERELSFAALADGEVVGFAILGRAVPGVLEHYMTGIRRDFRGRGIAQALKRAQIAAAKEAGYERLRTQNDLANAPMRAVNQRLGYRSRLEWVHFQGPLLEGLERGPAVV
jgi:GNAT superfamily N-acetyltransferase